MYLLIIFSDLEQQDIIFLGIFNKMKDMISYTDGVVRYTDNVCRNHNTTNRHKTVKKLFKVIKL